MEKLGRLIRTERSRRGMRGTDLGAAIGRDAAYISRLETGILKEIPDPATVAALAAALKITQVSILDAIGYQVREAPPAELPYDSERAALIALILRDLTEVDARVLSVTARAIVEARDARTVSEAERYALGLNPPAAQPLPVPAS